MKSVLNLENKGKKNIKYVMSKECATDLWVNRPKNTKGDKQHYLCDVVNEEYGLMGYCVEVVLD